MTPSPFQTPLLPQWLRFCEQDSPGAQGLLQSTSLLSALGPGSALGKRPDQAVLGQVLGTRGPCGIQTPLQGLLPRKLTVGGGALSKPLQD